MVKRKLSYSEKLIKNAGKYEDYYTKHYDEELKNLPPKKYKLKIKQKEKKPKKKNFMGIGKSKTGKSFRPTVTKGIKSWIGFVKPKE